MKMDPKFVVDEQTLRPLYGRAVCVVLIDNTRYTGILTTCGPSSITLNGERTNRPVNRTRKAKIQTEENQAHTQESDTSPSYWGKLNLEPPIACSTIKAVIPYQPIAAVWEI